MTSIHAGLFKLDGGAMFGIVPKRLWTRLIEADENNLCTWSMRCLLIEVEERKILVDTGMGDKQDAKFRHHFEPHGSYSLETSLNQAGYSTEDITDVFLTHLHFDHVGGAVKYNDKGELIPTFKNAKYWMHRKQFDSAMNPNIREKASFLKENFVPLVEQNRVEFLDFDKEMNWLNGIQLRCCYGHTQSMMVLSIPYQSTRVLYCADLMPSSYHIGMPYVMSYDVQPLVTLEEKKALLEEVHQQGYYIFYEHDALVECSKIEKNEKGRFIPGAPCNLKDIQ